MRPVIAKSMSVGRPAGVLDGCQPCERESHDTIDQSYVPATSPRSSARWFLCGASVQPSNGTPPWATIWVVRGCRTSNSGSVPTPSGVLAKKELLPLPSIRNESTMTSGTPLAMSNWYWAKACWPRSLGTVALYAWTLIVKLP